MTRMGKKRRNFGSRNCLSVKSVVQFLLLRLCRAVPFAHFRGNSLLPICRAALLRHPNSGHSGSSALPGRRRFLSCTLLLLFALLLMAAPEVLKAQYACNTNDDGSVCAYSTNADGSINIAAYAGPPWAGTIPGSINGMAVTTIGANAFGGCGSLTNVTIPNSVASIGPAAFYDCARLLSVTIPGGVTNIGCDAFEGCAMLANANIPDGVTSIADRTFAGCASLASVAIPGSVTNIGEFAFGFCPCLTNVTLAGGLAAIQETAFYCCPALASVTIPGSVTNLGDYAFGFCPGLAARIFRAALPRRIRRCSLRMPWRLSIICRALRDGAILLPDFRQRGGFFQTR